MSSLTLFEDFKSLFSDNLDFLYVHLNGYQLILDLVLLLLFLYVLFRKPAKPEKPLSEEEVEELIEGWVPEPLIPAKTPLMELDEKIPVISSTTPTHVTIDGRSILNMARFNFLGMIGNPKVEESASKALYKYGTGTCGPRGFYGTIDIHLELETRIKNFLKTEDCVIYSFGFATVASVIPAFSGRGDILIVDKGVSFSIQTGAKLSRSEIIWFEHNDMADLERVLKKVKEQDLKTRREITRRYIVTEGVFINYGDICPLPKIMELKEKYQFRLMLDDSYGIGSLGKTGRGTTEFFNVPTKDVEFLTGNLAAITSSVGGFCCGSKPITVHQRLNSSGYVYSASLPPLLAAASITAFDIIDENPNLLSQLANNIETIHKALRDIEGFVVLGSPNVALFHLKVAKSTGDRYSDEVILQDLVDEALAGGVLLTRAKYVHAKESFLPSPSIRITVSSANTKEQLLQSANVIKAAASKVMKKRVDLDKEQSKGNVGVARRTAVK